ncbi:MAG: outer membrane lipoprotein-sorting protein [Pseudomonadales bacterium]
MMRFSARIALLVILVLVPFGLPALQAGAADPTAPAPVPAPAPAAGEVQAGEVQAGEVQADAVHPSARELIAAALDLTRGRSSYAEMSMRIHRPDWERTSRLVAWTRGREDALIRFTEPARDAGNATLKQGDGMWTFTPKLNRTIRLPFSLMSQSWAGSDFSYNDLSRSDKLLKHYELTLVNAELGDDGHWIYTVDAVPHENAPVVWGKEELVLRDDFVMISETFFDQDLEPLKRMQALEIGELGGRTFSTRMRMSQLDEPEHFTEVVYEDAQFDIALSDELFTLFALRSGATP